MPSLKHQTALLTPVEIETFLADPAENAYKKVVDRLMASPRYGERWARGEEGVKSDAGQPCNVMVEDGKRANMDNYPASSNG